MLRVLSSILLILQISSARAGEECPTTNLLDKPPLSERKDIWQEDMGWCCSYAFTDALSANAGTNLSPVDLAITHAKRVNRIEGCLNLEQMLDTVKEMNGPGLCVEKDYEINAPPVSISKPSTIYNLGDLMLIVRNREAKPRGKTKGDALAQLYFFNESVKEIENLEEECIRAGPEFLEKFPLFDNIKNVSDIAQSAKVALNENFLSFLNELNQRNCDNRVPVHFESEHITLGSDIIAGPKHTIRMPSKQRQDGKKQIFTALQNGQPPVLIVDATSMFKIKPGLVKKMFSMMFGNHAVSIVGSRSVGGKCYLKVRDSTFGGPFCKEKKSDILCRPDGATNDMTYEIEMDDLLNNTKEGIILKSR